jgi:hypothetical protein
LVVLTTEKLYQIFLARKTIFLHHENAVCLSLLCPITEVGHLLDFVHEYQKTVVAGTWYAGPKIY